jgi:hypothetical protein
MISANNCALLLVMDAVNCGRGGFFFRGQNFHLNGSLHEF